MINTVTLTESSVNMPKNDTPPRKTLFSLFNMFTPQSSVARVETNDTSIKTQQLGSVAWTDMQAPKAADLDSIAKKHQLHTVQVGQSQHRSQIAQIAVEGDYIFLLLHFPYLIADENRIASSQVSIFLGRDYLVTIHGVETPVVRNMFDTYKQGEMSEVKSSGRLLFQLIEHLLREVETLMSTVSEELDEIEGNVFDDKGSDAFQIGQLRQKIMRLRRTLATQKDVLNELDGAIDPLTGERLARYYKSNTNMSRRLWENVEEARETIEIYKDADFTTSTEKTNDILAVLTLLFTLTIPATVIGTFYGMNILLPGGIEAGSWTFLGSFTALKVLLAISFVSAVCMYVYFRRRKWF